MRRIHLYRGIGWLVAAFALAPIPVAAGHQAERTERKTVDATNHTAIEISNPRGQTVVVGVDGVGEVRLVVTRIAQARDARRAEEALDQLRWDVDEKDGVLVIRTQNDQMESNRSVWSYIRGSRSTAFVDYFVEVPKRFAVRVSTTSGESRVRSVSGGVLVRATSGNIDLREVAGEVRVELTSGAVAVRDIQGDAHVRATSGSIVLERIGGAVEMSATSGDIDMQEVERDVKVQLVSGSLRLRGCLGDVIYTTQSGDAEILDVSGSISAISSSGDLDVVILPVGDKVFNLSSSSGNIDVQYKARDAYGFILDVNTGSGMIKGDMAIKVDRISRQRLTGVVGTGSSRVRIETGSGDVNIRPKNAPEK